MSRSRLLIVVGFVCVVVAVASPPGAAAGSAFWFAGLGLFATAWWLRRRERAVR